MKQIFPHMEVPNEPRMTATPSQLDAVERDLAICLPVSYRTFTQQFGYGSLVDFFRIYLPQTLHGCEDLFYAGRALATDIREAEKQDWIRYAPDGSRDLVLRLIPFGKSDNGAILAWDPEQNSEPGEFPIFIIGSRFSSVRRAAGSLYEFVERALRPNLDGMVGCIDEHLPATFVPASGEYENKYKK